METQNRGWRKPVRITAVYGSPRRKGNTSTLLNEAVQGARDAGAQVEELVLRDFQISPCLEIYGCAKTGECVIRDDFQKVRDTILAGEGIMLSSPMFFYTVSAHTKILMDRCQSLWVKKYWVEGVKAGTNVHHRKGLFISVGATKGKRLFDGALLTVKYFFDALDTSLWRFLLYRGLDLQGDVLQHPEYLQEARNAGKELVEAIVSGVIPEA